MPLIAQANHHEATAGPHDLGRLFDAVGDEQHPLVGPELLGPLGLELAQAEAIRHVGVKESRAVGGAAMWREVPGRVVVEVYQTRWEWDRMVGLLVESAGGSRWAGAVPLLQGEAAWEVGPVAPGWEAAVALWPGLLANGTSER